MSSPSSPVEGAAEPRDSVLKNLKIQKRTTGAKAAAHSQMVRRLRFVLPLLALLLLVVFSQNMQNNAPDEAFLKDFTFEAAPQELEMASPRFAGVDASGKPYEITADGATQAAQDDERIFLEKPRAVTAGNNAQTVVYSRKGTYTSQKQVLQLEDDVTLERSVGLNNYVLKTPAATVLLEQDKVQSDAGVEGIGNKGDTLRADRMTAYQEDGRVVFEGNVRLRINQTEVQPVITEQD